MLLCRVVFGQYLALKYFSRGVGSKLDSMTAVHQLMSLSIADDKTLLGEREESVKNLILERFGNMV